MRAIRSTSIPPSESLLAMRLVKVAAAALNQTPLDWDGNKANILGGPRRGPAPQGSAFSACPSFASPVTAARTRSCRPGVRRDGARRCSARSLPETPGMVVSLGLPLFHSNAVYNCCALVADGRMRRLRRQARAGGRRHPLRAALVQAVAAGPRGRGPSCAAQSYPIGDIYFDVRRGADRLRDLRGRLDRQRPGADLRSSGGRRDPESERQPLRVRQDTRSDAGSCSKARARSASSYVYANLLGNEAGRAIYDGGLFDRDAAARCWRAAPRFRFRDSRADHGSHRRRPHARAPASRFRAIEPDVESEPGECVEVAARVSGDRAGAPRAAARRLGDVARTSRKRSSRARCALGLFDYMRKSRSSGFVVSLSGGADSSRGARAWSR